MIKKTIICFCENCEKEYEVTKEFITENDAEEWAKLASKHYEVCPDCYKAGVNERLPLSEKMQRKAQRYGLPNLTGSDKQITWANQIRIDYFEKLAAEQNLYTECGVGFWMHVFENTTAALDWIRNKDNILSWARGVYSVDFIEEHPEFKGQKMRKK